MNEQKLLGEMVPRVFILGSCATRDAVEFAGEGLELAGYVARTSLASAFQERKAPKGLLRFLDRIDSSFQRRMVKMDLLKLTEGALRSAEFDYLLLDLVDERFNLTKISSDVCMPSLFTLSAEFYKAYGAKGEIVHSASREHWDYWRTGVDRLLEICPSERVILNKVLWAERASDGRDLTLQWDVTGANRWLGQMYAYLEMKKSIRAIDYGSGFLADPDHCWGLAPFHYTQDLYREAIASVKRIFAEDSGGKVGI